MDIRGCGELGVGIGLVPVGEKCGFFAGSNRVQQKATRPCINTPFSLRGDNQRTKTECVPRISALRVPCKTGSSADNLTCLPSYLPSCL